MTIRGLGLVGATGGWSGSFPQRVGNVIQKGVQGNSQPAQAMFGNVKDFATRNPVTALARLWGAGDGALSMVRSIGAPTLDGLASTLAAKARSAPTPELRMQYIDAAQKYTVLANRVRSTPTLTRAVTTRGGKVGQRVIPPGKASAPPLSTSPPPSGQSSNVSSLEASAKTGASSVSGAGVASSSGVASAASGQPAGLPPTSTSISNLIGIRDFDSPAASATSGPTEATTESGVSSVSGGPASTGGRGTSPSLQTQQPSYSSLLGFDDLVGDDGSTAGSGEPADWNAIPYDPSTGSVGAAPSNPKVYSSAYEFQLDPADYGRSRAVHFNRANAALHNDLMADPDYAAAMEQMSPGIVQRVSPFFGRRTPQDFTWEHASSTTANGRIGVMRLVPRAQHTPGSMWWRPIHPDPGAAGGYSQLVQLFGAPPNRR